MARQSLPSAVAGDEKGPTTYVRIAIQMDGQMLKDIIPQVDPCLVAGSAIFAALDDVPASNGLFFVGVGSRNEVIVSGPINDLWCAPVECRGICLVRNGDDPVRVARKLRDFGYDFGPEESVF